LADVPVAETTPLEALQTLHDLSERADELVDGRGDSRDGCGDSRGDSLDRQGEGDSYDGRDDRASQGRES
jgi:hypothetical protein